MSEVDADAWLDAWRCERCQHTARELLAAGDLSGEPPEGAWCCGCDEALIETARNCGGGGDVDALRIAVAAHRLASRST